MHYTGLVARHCPCFGATGTIDQGIRTFAHSTHDSLDARLALFILSPKPSCGDPERSCPARIEPLSRPIPRPSYGPHSQRLNTVLHRHEHYDTGTAIYTHIATFQTQPSIPATTQNTCSQIRRREITQSFMHRTGLLSAKTLTCIFPLPLKAPPSPGLSASKPTVYVM